MTKFSHTIAAVALIIWISLSVLFYFGILTIDPKGDIELSILLSFALALLGIHIMDVLTETTMRASAKQARLFKPRRNRKRTETPAQPSTTSTKDEKAL